MKQDYYANTQRNFLYSTHLEIVVFNMINLERTFNSLEYVAI